MRLIAALLLVFCAPGLSLEKGASYVGAQRCEPCHSAISAAWQKTRHAKALESLKKSGQENLPACVGCHVTGYELDGGFIDNDLTPEMAGVQCESCHGPGSSHVVNPSSNMTKAPGVELCRQCHTEKQDPKFDYDLKVLQVHPISGGRTAGSDSK